MDRRLTLWVLYKRPSDYPDHWIIRGQAVLPGGEIRPDPSALVGLTREEVTKHFLETYPGLYWIERSEGDEPHIVGSWV